jgi:hypothetical protein
LAAVVLPRRLNLAEPASAKVSTEPEVPSEPSSRPEVVVAAEVLSPQTATLQLLGTQHSEFAVRQAAARARNHTLLTSPLPESRGLATRAVILFTVRPARFILSEVAAVLAVLAALHRLRGMEQRVPEKNRQ